MQETNTSEEIKEEPKAQVETQEVPQEETQEQINWKKFRADNLKNKKAKEEAELRAKEKAEETETLKNALAEVVNKKSNVQDDGVEEDDNVRIQKEVERILAIKEAERENARKAQELSSLPQKLASAHSDFTAVCSEDNLLYFEYHFADQATAFKYMPDSFEKWDNLYKSIKRVMPDAAKKTHYEAVAEKNLNAPKSHATAAGIPKTGGTSLGLSDDAKKANWKNMQARMKGL